MKAFRFDRLPGIHNLTLHDEQEPVAQRGEVLIKIRAISLNRRDPLIAEGGYPGPVAKGRVPCSDAAGEVVAVGEGVTAFRTGDRVISTFHPRWFGGRPPATVANDTYGNGSDGWLMEYKAVSQEAVVPLPSGLSYEEGCTLPCAAVTAWNALSGPAPVRAGDTVLTLGSGGVSVFAIQLAKALGATVISTTSSDRKGEQLLGLGADRIVDYQTIDAWGRYVRQEVSGGTGVDRVVDVVGAGALHHSLAAVRRGGEVVLVGQLSTSGPALDAAQIKASGAMLRPVGVGDRVLLEELLRVVVGACVKPVISRVFEFAESTAAMRALGSNEHVGKIVITFPS
ncbi:zinc-dependent alcohol dehydrogenase family protein [Burkholderia cenocepacia]|uniref:zinc-dependent alcohol dehydrogenase family protein n=1 Tax=Burkholderia cenocepacia TaxID=95486 RepID=UPI0019070C90|nr:NAD(P)-dependent alcohol dehydrogenase [Burkholderia cenocepacia]MBJ9698538.1 NAD(P)-dependent alcohol dehydrogenase [Burkholderia cenocepacia]